MAEQTFKSPGFFEREIEIINRPIIGRNLATPAAVIGTAQRGPAFVPTLISSPEEFVRVFGNYEKESVRDFVDNEFLERKTSWSCRRRILRIFRKSCFILPRIRIRCFKLRQLNKRRIQIRRKN